MKERLLEDVFEFIRNGASIKQSEGKQGCPITRIETIWNKTIDNERFGFADIFENDLSKYQKYLMRKGDILMSHINSPKHLGKSAIYKGKPELLLHGMNLLALRPNTAISFPQYLSYYLNSKLFKVQLPKISNQSVNQASFSSGKLKKLSVPLPPLEQQKKIAAILDAADIYRQKTKALITKYDELTQSLFLDMFGSLVGDKISLSTICDINPKKSEISSVDRSTLVSFMPMANVSVEGQVSHIEERTIDEVWSGFTYFKENDVVFAKITPCMENGKGAIMRNLKNSVGFGTTEFHVLRPLKAHSTAEYLYHLTHSEHFRALAEVNMTGSAGQKRVPRDFFDKFKVVAPALILQNQFAERVQAIEVQKAQAQASLAQAEDLFNSLLQRAFKGELNS